MDTCKDCLIFKLHGKHKMMFTRLEHDGKNYGVLAVSIQEHIAADRERSVSAKSTGFADAMKRGLRTIAEKKGFSFGK